MRKSSKVELHTWLTGAEVLSRIEQSTERERLPFISASRYPQQIEKGFVASVSGGRFRLWRVPSSSRARQNTCVPYLRGTVAEVSGGSEVKGTFALHPFNKLLIVMPLVIAALPWLWGERTTRTVIILSVWSLILVVFALAVVGTVRRLRLQEEQDIAAFLVSLVTGDAVETVGPNNCSPLSRHFGSRQTNETRP